MGTFLHSLHRDRIFYKRGAILLTSIIYILLLQIILYVKSQLHMRSVVQMLKSKVKALGPYSVATHYNHHIYVSGLLGIDIQTTELVSDDVEQQTRKAMENFKMLLTQYKCEFSYVAKTTIFLKDMSDIAKVDSVYSQYFKNHRPARSCVAVAGLPKDAKFELQAIVAYPYSISQLDNDIKWPGDE